MDHTDFSGSTYSYSQKLTGGVNSQVGVAKSMKVYPEDKVKVEAYAKYYNPSGSSSNITGFAAALTSAFGVSSVSTGEALKAYTALNDYGGFIAAGGPDDTDEDYPKLFVNILLFDKDHNFLDAAWEQIDGGEQIGATPKAAHDYMSKEVTVKEAGFAYVFISNENPTLVEFYVDDVVIIHTPTHVIQYNEYYPFGLQTSTSWTREGTKDNNYLYNASNELNKTSGWYEMFYRGYDPAIGRMLQVDPYATMYASVTTYNYAINNPVMINDPSGGQVDATGLSNSQLRGLYLANRWRDSSTGDFADWASDNVTGTSLDGSYFGSMAGGRWALFEYYYTDNKTGKEDPEAGYSYQWDFIPDTSTDPKNPIDWFLNRMKTWLKQFETNGDNVFNGNNAKEVHKLSQVNNQMSTISKTRVSPYFSVSLGKYGGFLSDNHTLTVTTDGLYYSIGVDFTVDAGGNLPNIGGSIGFTLGPEGSMEGLNWGATGGAAFIGLETGGSINYSPNITLGAPSSFGFTASTSRVWAGVNASYTVPLYKFK